MELPDPPERKRGRRTLYDLPPIPDEVVGHVIELAAETIVPEPDELSMEDDGLTELERQQLREILNEFAQREMEALHLFEPMQEQEKFFSSHADERVAIGGNRGGKTTVTCVEIARAVTGQDPHDKYPKTNGRIVLVGKDLNHCSKVFFRKLFKPGAFQIIRDEITGNWRVYRPNDARDIEREEEARPAPPLISPRFYDASKISWDNKKEELPKTVRLKNGWEMYFFSSLGIPPQGWDVDLVAFDEEIEHPLWYPEMSARLLDRRKKNRATGHTKSGKFIWSATPQAGTVQLYHLVHRAEDELDDATKTIEVFRFGMLDNEFVSAHSKESFIKKFVDNEEEYRVRVLGEFALLGTRVYGEFLPGRAGSGKPAPHGTDSFPIPHEWTRYAALDPGRQVCAILFAAVPPPGHPEAGRVFFYDECYVKRADAASVAKAVKAKLGDQRIHKWYLDARAGRITEIGSGLTHEEQYRRAFMKEKVFYKGGPMGFVWSTASGSDDVRAGIEAVRGGLHLDEDGKSRWVVFRDKCKFMCWEAEIYSYKRLPSGLVTDEVIKANDHIMDCWRYLSMGRLSYHRPPAKKPAEGYTAKALRAKEQRKRARNGLSDSIELY